MNLRQASYQMGRVAYGMAHYIYLAAVPYLLENSLGYFQASSEIADHDFLSGLVFAAAGALAGAYSISCTADQLRIMRISGEAAKYKEEYPLEVIDKITITDQQGLEMLLEKTRQTRLKELGTVFMARCEGNTAEIYDILDFDLAKEQGFATGQKFGSVTINARKASEAGYSGTHHSHPRIRPLWFGGHNFSISPSDRITSGDWLNLLTFNMPYGPEIIGYNLKHTYIPSDKSKTELVKAGPQKIMEYLASR